MDGVRPLLAEVQSLTVDPVAKNPRRVVTGLDTNRVPMVLAVLQARAGERSNEKDAYVATVGGVRITETATDLAVALATWSSLHERPLPPKTVVIGEVGPPANCGAYQPKCHCGGRPPRLRVRVVPAGEKLTVPGCGWRRPRCARRSHASQG